MDDYETERSFSKSFNPESTKWLIGSSKVNVLQVTCSMALSEKESETVTLMGQDELMSWNLNQFLQINLQKSIMMANTYVSKNYQPKCDSKKWNEP